MTSMMSRIFAAALLSALSWSAPGSAQAADYTFIPKQFYTTWSFDHPPALHIKPGDRVMTKTVDAAGVDWNGKQVTTGPNPQTGPFYIDGAEPGDTIVVTIEKLETNRAMAYSGSLLAPYATDPTAIAARVDREPKRVTWTIDKAKGIATLDQSDILAKTVQFPLRPMLGCIGVAPARKEAISTAYPGAFGGNMDYAFMGQGIKLMLPVNEPGALLYLGDGHARQGEGEVVGSGMETSMDVTFRVDLIKKKQIAWPRAETATHIIVLGSAKPLVDALQHANAEMQQWLMSDYGFSERGAQVFMGEAGEYEISNVVDPAFTVAAKIPKSLLPKR